MSVDEPLSNLDAALRVGMRMEIGKLHKQLGATMIHVTHDQDEAMTLSDKIVVLKDGLVQQIGAPMDLYHKPANAFVAGFPGAPSMNFPDVQVTGRTGDRMAVANGALDPVEVASVDGATLGSKLRLGIRPQDLTTTSTGSGTLHGTVALTERLGSETIVEVILRDGKPVIAAMPQDTVFALGSTGALRFDPAQAHLFA